MSVVREFIRKPAFRDVPTKELTPRDHTLIRIWLNGVLSEEDLAATLTWWASSREPGQGMVEFFIAQHILLRSTGVALDQIAAGVPIGSGVSFFTTHGQQSLRELLASRPSPASNSEARPGAMQTPIRQTRLGRRSGRSGSTILARNRTLSNRPANAEKTSERKLPRVGTQFGRCLLTEPIGELRGGGYMFRALHRTLNLCVVVKLFADAELDREPGLAIQFTDNARRLTELHHPHVQRVWECEHCEGFTYVVLEQVDGLSLRELIQQSGRIRPDRAMSLIAQAVEGLGFAAEAGIPHRDVRSRNILLTREGVVKLAGLDVACLKRESLGPGDADSPRGAYYAAPETSGGGTHDLRSDIYSLGVTFYYAITGRLPFLGETRMEVMLKHQQEEPTPPHMIRPGIDPAISEVILKAMAKQPEDRYSTFRELGGALIDLEGELLGRTQQVRTPVKKGGVAAAQRDAWQMLLHRYGGGA